MIKSEYSKSDMCADMSSFIGSSILFGLFVKNPVLALALGFFSAIFIRLLSIKLYNKKK